MEGRWLVWVEDIKDWQNVVPCDDAAVERAAQALHRCLGFSDASWDSGRCACRLNAEFILRAAGETP